MNREEQLSGSSRPPLPAPARHARCRQAPPPPVVPCHRQAPPTPSPHPTGTPATPSPHPTCTPDPLPAPHPVTPWPPIPNQPAQCLLQWLSAPNTLNIQIANPFEGRRAVHLSSGTGQRAHQMGRLGSALFGSDWPQNTEANLWTNTKLHR